MDGSTPGPPVHHQILELTQTHVHWVGNTIQPSHPLPSPSPPALNLSQHQGLFQWVSSSHQGAKVLQLLALVLPVNIQDRFPLEWTGWISLQSKGLSRVFSSTSLQKYQFFGAQLLYSPTLTNINDYRKNPSFDYTDLCWQSNVSALRLYWMRLKIKRHKQCREHRCWHIWVAQYVIVDWLHTCLLTDRQYFRGVGGDPICRTDTS